VPRAIADTLKPREMAARVVALAGFALVLRTLTEGGAPAAARPPRRHPGPRASDRFLPSPRVQVGDGQLPLR
jgi:hypothetical protein